MLPLKNQFIFAPIKTGYSDGTGVVTARHLAFYKRRSRYLGAVIPEPFYMDEGLRELPTQMGIDNDDKIEGLRKLTALLHETETAAIAHLNHPGRMANPKIPGNYFISATDKPCENGGAVPLRMTQKDIDNVIGQFVESAVRAEKAGFDMLELQFGHGYLVAQFLSPFVNDRTDGYGGGLEQRARFAMEILEAVKAAVDLPIIIRISGDEMIPDGIQLPEMEEFARFLERAGAAAVHVSAGTVCSTPPWFFQHMFIPKGKTWKMAGQIKNEIKIPVIAVGQVNEIKDIEKINREKISDYIAIGRALVADPDFVGKYMGEITGEIRPCLACAEGCLGGVRAGKGLQCLVNPAVGREGETFKLPRKTKKYAVVGGGLAGMEAALDLEKRGHRVDLFEKNELGGQFNLAYLTPHKKSMEKIVRYYKKELDNSKVNIVYKEASASDLTSYDGVILATGSVPKVPSIPGLEKFYWAEILLENNLPRNKKVLIIGGGLVGVDIATALIPRDNRVVIVKRTTDFGEDMEMIAKNLSLKLMREKGVVFSDHTHIRKIEGKTVFAERNGKDIRFDDVDIVVVSTGMMSCNNTMEQELEATVPIYVIGDAKMVGNAQDAIRDGYMTANVL
ncbi:MAG: FAD-dependent oxidoreductase [Fidelibacterota bacterium]